MHSAHFPLTTQGLTSPSRQLAPRPSKRIREKAARRSSDRSVAHAHMTVIDWAQLRADTPAAEKVLHLNNAGN